MERAKSSCTPAVVRAPWDPFEEQHARQTLAHLLEGERIHQIGVRTQALGHQLQSGEREGGMAQHELAHVRLVEEQHRARLVGDGGGGVGSVIEDGHFGESGALAFGMDDLFAPLRVHSKGADDAGCDDIEAGGWFSGEEQHLARGELALVR